MVCVYVVALPVFVAANRGNDWNIVAFEQCLKKVNLYLDNIADKADIQAIDKFFSHFKHAAVLTGNADRGDITVFQKLVNFLVDFTGEHHLCHFDDVIVGDAQTVDKLSLNIQIV